MKVALLREPQPVHIETLMLRVSCLKEEPLEEPWMWLLGRLPRACIRVTRNVFAMRLLRTAVSSRQNSTSTVGRRYAAGACANAQAMRCLRKRKKRQAHDLRRDGPATCSFAVSRAQNMQVNAVWQQQL